MRDLLTLSRAILLGFRRDKGALFFTIAFPLVFLVILGGLFHNNGVPRSVVVEVGHVQVLDNLTGDARTQVNRVLDVQSAPTLADALSRVRSGAAAAAIEQDGTQLRLQYSAADATSSGTVRAVVQALVQAANISATNQPPKFSFASSQVEDASLKQIQYLTPGILGWAIASGATFGAASTLVGWRQKRLLRRLNLTPIRMSTVVSARLLVSLGIALVQTALFLVVATTFFGLQLHGSWWLSIPLVLAGTLAFLSIGLLAGAKVKSGETANALANLIVIPMAFLSGSFFPLSLAPAWLQKVSEVLPLRHLNDSMLDVMARGSGPLGVLPQFALLLGFAIVVTALAVSMFRWDDI